MRGREGGRRGSGRREKWGWEEGEEGGREGEGRKKGREGERGKFCTCEARAAPEGRRETRGREGGGKGGGLPSCPPLISNTLSPAMITLLHDNRMLTQLD